MSEPSAPPPETPGLTRAKAEAMLAHLSAAVGAPLALDGQNTVAFSYFDDGEATLLFAEPLGYFMLVAPVADPEEIELARLRDLLEFNMEWERPAAIIIPDNDPRPHLAMMLPVDPDEPASLEFAIVNTVRLAGELTAVSGVIDIPEPPAAPVNEHFA